MNKEAITVQQSKQAAVESPAARVVDELAEVEPQELTGRQRLYKSEEGYKVIMDWYDGVTASIPADIASRYVPTRFGRTHMLVAGPEDAPPLLLIPGIAGCAPLWRRQIPAFAEHFRVYALDIIGQPGKSDPSTPSFLNDDMYLWLLDVLDGLNISRAHIAGTSVGGWMAMRFAIFAPERVNKIVMLSPTGVSRARLPIRIWITKYLNKWRDADALQDDLTAKSVTNKSPGRSFGTFDRQLAKLMALCTRHYRVDRSLGVYNEKSGKVSFIEGMKVLKTFFLSEPRSTLRKFTSDGLLILGEFEVLYNPWKVAERAARFMPQLETDVIQGAGHAAIYDKPELANERVIAYLRG
jgi:pimeloyl-ACP methyl ester carboxylesterase